jgi:hypothetical protein
MTAAVQSNDSTNLRDQRGSGDRLAAADAGRRKEIVYSPESELRAGGRSCRHSGVRRRSRVAWRLFQHLRGMYRQTVLGIFWAFAAVGKRVSLIFVCPKVVDFGDDMPAVPLYVLTGMIIWQSFVKSDQMPLNVYARIGR